MDKQINTRLWVIKLCVTIVYPKFNFYVFMIYLVVKYRIYRLRQLMQIDIDIHKVKTVSSIVQKNLLKNISKHNLSAVHKCLIIPQNQFEKLMCENLFYLDNGMLWIGLRVAFDCRRKLMEKKQTAKYGFNLMNSNISKKLWLDEASTKYNTVRIVPVTGSNFIEKNIIVTTEDEYENIVTSFGLTDKSNFKLSFHTIPSIQYAPKIAATAEVKLIVNDYDISNDFIKEVLSNYFDTPKILHANDIFHIKLAPEITDKYTYKYSDLIQSLGKLYFKCTNLVCSNSSIVNDSDKYQKYSIQQALYIVKGVTQLILGENVHTLRPQDQFFDSVNFEEESLSLLSMCPTGLKQKFNEIQNTVKPFLTENADILSCSVMNPIIPMLLLTGPVGSGRHLLVKFLAKYNGMNYLSIDCNVVQSSTAKQTESKISSMIQRAKAASPVIVLMDNFEVFAVDAENNEDCRVIEYFINTTTELYQNYTKHPIIFIALTECTELKPNILRLFLDKFHVTRPSAHQRYEILEWFASIMHLNVENTDHIDLSKQTITDSGEVTDLNEHSKFILQKIAAKTETFRYGDIDTLMHFALRESYLKQYNNLNLLPQEPNFQYVEEEDFNSALEQIRSLQSRHLDAPKIPKVFWEDIGGLQKLKRELLKTIEFPIKYPHLFKNSTLKRSGILLYGPPGCGKTLVAKAVSTELNVSFLSVKGPELLNMYIGQSEENVRKVFESARASSPCIVFLDELDALAPRRGAAGDSGGASDRVVSQLLAELDGVTSVEDADTTSFVFIMGATNRPDLLDQSLLRPGRLDKLIYVGPYDGIEEKTNVLKALCRSYKVREEVNLERVAASLPDRCTGADLLHVVSTARAAAVRAVVAKLHAGIVKDSDLSPESIIIGVSDLWEGVETFRPSVTEEEMAYYESLQSQM